jgi:hypothetical protein
MFSGSNIEKENVLLEFSATREHASLIENEGFDRELLFSPKQKKKNPLKSVKKGKDLKTD